MYLFVSYNLLWYLRVQNRGSSLPSPQSLALSQYLLRATHRPLEQRYWDNEQFTLSWYVGCEVTIDEAASILLKEIDVDSPNMLKEGNGDEDNIGDILLLLTTEAKAVVSVAFNIAATLSFRLSDSVCTSV